MPQFKIENLWNGELLTTVETSQTSETATFLINVDLTKDHDNCILMQIIIEAPYFDNDTIPDCDKQFSSPNLWEHEVVEYFISSPIVSNDVKITPYTEIILGPHGHWLIMNHTGQENWSECNDSIHLEAKYLPTTHIDYSNKKWFSRMTIPIEILPSPFQIHNEDKTTMSWLFNVYAIHNIYKATNEKNQDNRRHMACHSLPGHVPRFHQLESFQPLNLEL